MFPFALQHFLAFPWSRRQARLTSDGLDDRRHKPRRHELLNRVVRLLFFPNISPEGSNSTAHLLELFCCYTKLISQKFGLQLHHFVYVLGVH
jgi:hypothetical protein